MNEDDDEEQLLSTPLAGEAYSLQEAVKYASFARYMARCLYDPAFGYYGGGKVAFGRSRHYWTYPQRLRPLFGWMVAEVARSVFESLNASGRTRTDAPLTILELGGGDGDLARDTLDYIVERTRTPDWGPFASRVRYVIAEPHEPMRQRQRQRLRHYVESGRADIRDLEAGDLRWQGPFHGLVVANEVLTSLPCEKLRLVARGPKARRVHVVPVAETGWAAAAGVQASELHDPPDALSGKLAVNERGLDEAAFWRWVEEDRWDSEEGGCRLAELEVPLSLGWSDEKGQAASTPTDLQAYLEGLEPLVADLETCGLLPVDLHWSPHLSRFAQGLAALLSGSAERSGVALILDYGGTSRHVLDPRSAGHHLRIYGGLRLYDHQPLPYLGPAAHDMTCDVDFTEVARLARKAGLEVPFFGHQNALESPPVDLLTNTSLQHLIRGRMAEGTEDLSEASLEVEELIVAFREAPGFRLLIISGEDTAFNPSRFGESDSLDGLGLYTLCANVAPERLREMFVREGLPPQAAAGLKPCGDPVADLSDRHLYRLRRPVLELLDRHGFLVEPGALR